MKEYETTAENLLNLGDEIRGRAKPVSPSIIRISETISKLTRISAELRLKTNIEINLDYSGYRNLIISLCEYMNLGYKMYRKGDQVRRKAVINNGGNKITVHEKIQ